MTRETIRFIELHKDRPFVAYLGHYTPHIPYTAKPHLIDKHANAFEPVYAALIETLDDTIGLGYEPRFSEGSQTARQLVACPMTAQPCA
ncbi:MAG: hypothetical protein K9N49_09720 [Candidatus Marinimicrobia bacterium]|nr:hypothetical protein [Candidatus Neomarinimicrobiota bacterium]